MSFAVSLPLLLGLPKVPMRCGATRIYAMEIPTGGLRAIRSALDAPTTSIVRHNPLGKCVPGRYATMWCALEIILALRIVGLRVGSVGFRSATAVVIERRETSRYAQSAAGMRVWTVVGRLVVAQVRYAFGLADATNTFS